MATKYLDSNGLLYLWGKIKAAFVSNVSYNSTTKRLQMTKNGATSDIVTLITSEDIPEGASASTTTPKMDGTATVGSETAFARGDHIHPSDTSRVPTTRTINGKALSSNITLSASDVGALPSSTTIPSPGTGSSYPVMDGTRSLGSQAGYARVDHVHPSDTTKVDKENGKGLSANDYTTTEKNKLANIANGADVTRLTLAGSSTGSQVASGDTMRFIGGGGFITTAAGYSQDEEPQITISLNSSKINVASGLLQLNSSAKIDSTYLPSYVDDVIEAYPRSGQTELSSTWLSTTSGGSALTPEAGKIYILMADSTSYATNTQFRWSGSAYVKMLDGGITAITNSEIDTIVAS